MAGPGIPCSYCGGRHERAAEVRECWQRSAGAEDSGTTAAEASGSAGAAGHGTAGAPNGSHAAPGERVGAGEGGRSVGCAPVSNGPVLGRSVLVAPGQDPPPAWRGCQRASGSLEELEAAFAARVPLVIEVDDEPLPDEVERRPVWSLSPAFAFAGERLAHARRANAADARHGPASFALVGEACRLGARLPGAGEAAALEAVGGAGAGGEAAALEAGTAVADIVLPDGREAVLDGGPLEWREQVSGLAVLPRAAVLAGSLVPFGSNDCPAALAPDQLAAVTHPGAAARIIAPAGSGKTRVLTERARHLLRRWGLPGRSLTLVAFNKRAADEMLERTPDLPELQVRTLNALGLSLLGRHRPATTIEEREVRTILGTLVDLPRRANADPAAAWIEALSAVRLGLRPPAQVEAELEGDVDGLPEVFDRYRAILAERRLVDFDEQIYGALEVLLTDPAARRSARSSCRVMLVDEFQDLTPAHLLLVRLLAGPDGAVFGVGDDDQTIYGYSGASPQWLIEYASFFPGAGEHALEVNYRCPVGVVEAARHLLTYNRQRVSKSMVAAPGRLAAPGELRLRADGDALSSTVETVEHLLAGGAAPGEVAVLSRVNSSLAPVQVALVHRQVAVRPAVDVSWLARNGVQAALAWLRLACAPAGRLGGPDVALAARRPSRALSPRLVEWMAEQSSMRGLEALAGRLSGRDPEKVEGFVADLRALRATAESGSTAALLRAVRDDIGLDQAMELLETSRRRLDRSAQTDDLDALVALAALHPEPAGFEAWLRAALAEPGSPAGVVLSTVHRVKGREWPHVVLHEVSEGLMPHRLSSDVEEERRVLHVGLTRGSRSVTVVAGVRPSPFLAELEADRAEEDRTPAALLRARATERPGTRPAARRGAGGPRSGAPATPFEDGTANGAPSEVVERSREALRAWRSARAASEGKPAYVYLHDRTIESLAALQPGSMAALSRVSGIGPAKLEAYGDELLALLASAREPS